MTKDGITFFKITVLYPLHLSHKDDSSRGIVFPFLLTVDPTKPILRTEAFLKKGLGYGAGIYNGREDWGSSLHDPVSQEKLEFLASKC